MGTELPRIAILGTGSMGGAILGGLLAPGVTTGGIRVTTRSEASAAALRQRGVEAFSLEQTPDANARAVADAGIVLLGVKPAQIVDTLASVSSALAPDALVISVAAGITTAAMEAVAANPVLRAMPNTPSTVGLGVTGLSAGSRADASHVGLGRALFETVGEVVVVPEAQLDALSTVSGSGPAYVFLLIEQLTAAAGRLGFDAEQSKLLVQGTFRGAVELLAASGADPADLRRQVTSPNGTTERAVAVLEAAELGELFDHALAAALARARELAAG